VNDIVVILKPWRVMSSRDVEAIALTMHMTLHRGRRLLCLQPVSTSERNQTSSETAAATNDDIHPKSDTVAAATLL
jgi:hypothetical protein